MASVAWVSVCDIARWLDLSQDVVEQTVRRAAAKGWFELADGPTLKVRLRVDIEQGSRGSRPIPCRRQLSRASN